MEVHIGLVTSGWREIFLLKRRTVQSFLEDGYTWVYTVGQNAIPCRLGPLGSRLSS